MKNENPLLVVFCGGSSSGKTTVENKMIEENEANRVVSFCSRPMRPGEGEGKDYYFTTEEEVLAKNNVLEIPIEPGWIYSVEEEEILRDMNHDRIYSAINIKPAEEIISYVKDNNLPFDVFFVFFDVDVEQRIDLLKKRGETEESIRIRLAREDQIGDLNIEPNLVITDIFTAHEVVKAKIEEFINERRMTRIPSSLNKDLPITDVSSGNKI